MQEAKSPTTVRALRRGFTKEIPVDMKPKAHTVNIKKQKQPSDVPLKIKSPKLLALEALEHMRTETIEKLERAMADPIERELEVKKLDEML